MSNTAEITAYVLTISDRCSRNEAVDKSGLQVVHYVLAGAAKTGIQIDYK